MILSDYHIHSNYSIDSDEPMEESVCVAIKKGLKEMIFTDHLETLNRNEPIREVIDYKEYTEEIDRLQQKYAGQIKIKLGAEINLEAELCDQYNACIREFDFDLIIG
ncbi:MAG: PHP domain-containing protein, partial [Peptostreptococcaceae bacterium]|nr:PHP domain-containing protein [Peptostreptococcaceae bacterium]